MVEVEVEVAEVRECQEIYLRPLSSDEPHTSCSRRDVFLPVGTIHCEPMRASSVGARRFFDAFYRWTLLTETSHPCTRVLSTSKRYVGQDSRRGNRGKQPFSGARRVKIHHEEASVKPLTTKTNGDSPQLPNIYEQNVRSVDERPFSAMEPWEEVVRYKSIAGFSIEMCIPQDVVTQIERETGSLYNLVGVQNLQIDLGHPMVKQSASGQSNSVRSVLVTGSAEDIENLRIQLQQTRTVSTPVVDKSVNTKSERIERHIRTSTPSLQNHVKNIEDVEVQQEGNEDRDTQSDPSPGSSRPSEDRTEKDLAGREHYFLELRWPLKLSSNKDETPFYWPPGLGSQLRDTQQRTQCTMKLNTSFLRLDGPLSGILEARRAMQAYFDEACDNQGVARREFQDVVALAKYPDATQDIKRRRREQKLDRFKEAVRPLTHPVVLVTASLLVNREDKTIDHYRGVTVSSFTSVSMSSPDPLVSFNLKLPSRTWDAMKSNKVIGINLLDASPEGAAIAHAFTQPHDDPSEAFREIRRLGYELVPFLNWAHCIDKPASKRGSHSGVYCTLAAEVMKSKCIEVGDHVIVVAGVKFMRWVKVAKEKAADGELFGLAYHNKEYRTAGHAIKAVSIPEQDELRNDSEPTEIDVSEDVEDEHAGSDLGTNDSPGISEINETPMNHIMGPDIHSIDVQDDEPFIEDQTSILAADSATTGAGDLSDDPFAHPSTPVEDGLMTASLEHMDADLASGLDPFEQSDQASSESISNKPTSRPLQNNNSRPSGTQPTSNILPGFLQGWYRRYNTSARILAAQAVQAQSSTTEKNPQHEANTSNKSVPSITDDDVSSRYDDEHYHGTSTNAKTSAINQGETWATNDGNVVRSGVADETFLSITISDFLNSHDDDPYRPRRMRALMKARREAYKASKRLERNLETGTLTSEEVYRLERTVMLNERWIAKRLAFNSAYDLRLMLDKGKVDFKRAQWLESSIEKGQAVLLAELNHVRERVEGGQMPEEKYGVVKANLETDHQTLATEAMRLRQIVEEEGYDGASALVQEKKDFDGFRGNV